MIAVPFHNQPATEDVARTVTVWDQNGPFGSIALLNGKLVASADQVARQNELERFLRDKRRLWTRRAQKEGWQFDENSFFNDMPRFLAGTMIFATRPLHSFEEALPSDLHLPPFDPFKKRQPRKRP
jgi:hypothetical protein